MSRNLLIFRHAKSAWDTDAPSDFERPLASRGLRDAPRMGDWLRHQGLKPDYIVSSPAARAKATTHLARKKLAVKKKKIYWDKRIYGAPCEELLQVLEDCPEKASLVMLVGHNPGLEDLLTYLWGEDTEVPLDGKLLPTATTALVELPESWKDLKRGAGKVILIKRPKEIE